MRRSLSGSSGGMSRAVERAVRSVGGAAQSPNNTSRRRATSGGHAFNDKPSSALSLSTTLINNVLPVSPTTLDSDWECLDNGCEDENVFFDDCSNILGPVPSIDEVHHALSAIHQVFEPSYFSYSTKNGLDAADEITSSINLTREVSSNESVTDWIEPSIHICNSKLLQSYGSNRVYDAFHLLQTEPSVQKMVISLSSDKAVWDAVLNNEAVREIRDSLKQVYAADDVALPGSSEEGFDKSNHRSGGTKDDVLSWIVVNTKERVMEMIDKIIEFVNEWFLPQEREEASEEGNTTDPFDEKLRTSFFLSVVVLLIVVVARAQSA